MTFIGGVVQAVLTVVIVQDVLTAPVEKELTIDQIIVNKTHGYRDGTIIDNKYVLVQHDMLLTEQQYQEMYGNNGQARKRGSATKHAAHLWPNGVIPYEFQANIRGDKNIVYAAMQEWQSKTCVKFRQRTSADRNYLRVYNGKGCNSPVGAWSSGALSLSLEYPGCWDHRVALHELGHLIGLNHEQQHPDAGNYLTVNYQNISPDCHQWWRPMSASSVNTYGVGYDYYSIMHYGVRDCALNGKNAYTTKDSRYQGVPGSQKNLSAKDVQIVKLMYKCGGGCQDQNANCAYWAGVGECQKNPGYMLVNCKRSCNRC